MSDEIKIPQMGESITEATIGAFLKPSGSIVAENEEIIELETEKVNQVLYAPSSGLLKWSVSEGDTVTIGQVIGVVEESDEKPQAPPPKEEQVLPPPKETPKPAPEPTKPPEVTPTVSGEKRRLMKEDFLASLDEAPSPKEKPEKKPCVGETEVRESARKMPKIRKVIASRLVSVLNESAMLTTFNEADMGAIMELRKKYKESFQERHGVKLGFMSFFVKAVCEALREMPDLNSYIVGDEIIQRHYYDIGIAVGTDRGLVVPVVRDADTLSFAGIERSIVEYAKKARSGRLAISDLEGGGFTITNGGVYGSLLSTPILNPPQVGILGMHKIQQRPCARNGEVVIRPMMYLALSYDHRIVDGKEAVTFLVRLAELLEDPARLMLEEEG